MKYRKFNKLERKEIRSQVISELVSGGGLYLYQNSNANAELTLPRPTKSGLRVIAPKGNFQGDSYYMQLVQTGMLRLIEVLQTPEQEKEVKMNEEKLILDQPDTFNELGSVEHVVSKGAKQKLNESNPKEEQGPVLLNEGPVVDDGFVIVT